MLEPAPHVLHAGVLALRLEQGSASNVLTATQADSLVGTIAAGRDLLLYFRGCISSFAAGICEHRNRIFASKFVPPVDQPDVVVIAECCGNFRTPPPHLIVAHCRGCNNNRKDDRISCTAQWPNITFHEGLRRAKFAFAPRGCGPLTYRLLEAMGQGSVPVMTGADVVMPFAGEGSLGRLWTQCVVYVKEDDLKFMIDKLRNMKDEEYLQRLVACAQIAALRSHRLDVMAVQTMCILATRIASQLAKVGEWGEARRESWLHPLIDICGPVGVTLQGGAADELPVNGSEAAGVPAWTGLEGGAGDMVANSALQDGAGVVPAAAGSQAVPAIATMVAGLQASNAGSSATSNVQDGEGASTASTGVSGVGDASAAFEVQRAESATDPRAGVADSSAVGDSLPASERTSELPEAKSGEQPYNVFDMKGGEDLSGAPSELEFNSFALHFDAHGGVLPSPGRADASESSGSLGVGSGSAD